MTTQDVLKEIATIEALLTLLPDVPGIYPQWKRIVAHYNAQGVKVYDARLVAVMNVYSIDHLLTFNVVDFKRYSNITALLPSTLSSP